MSDTARIKRGLSANLLSIGTRMAVQFATLPIFFAHWSVQAVGVWLILFAVPSYVALVGNGFAGAGGTAALAAMEAGNLDEARAQFRASWIISAVATALLALLFAAGAIAFVPMMADQSSALDINDIAQAAAWLGLYVFATSQMSVFDIPFRAVGRYPDHIFLYNAASLLEIALIAIVVSVWDGFADLAMALALYRCVAAGWIWWRARRAAPALFATGATRWSSTLAQLWIPSVAFMMMPLIYGLNLQGYLLLVGGSFGAVVLAGYAATRTLTRLLDLVSGLIWSMQFYESGYLGSDRRKVQRRLLATMTCLALAASLAFAVTLMVFGPWIQSVYTLGETRFDPAVAWVLLAAVTVRALAVTPAAFVAALNTHAAMTMTYLAGSAAGLLMATGLALSGASLPVVLMPLVLAEAAQCIPAFRQTLTALDLTFAEFVRNLWSRDRLADLERLWRMTRGRT